MGGWVGLLSEYEWKTEKETTTSSRQQIHQHLCPSLPPSPPSLLLPSFPPSLVSHLPRDDQNLGDVGGQTFEAPHLRQILGREGGR